jgi:hypothetical protein
LQQLALIKQTRGYIPASAQIKTFLKKVWSIFANHRLYAAKNTAAATRFQALTSDFST